MFQPNEATVLGLPPTLNERCVCVCDFTSDSRYGKATYEIWLPVGFFGGVENSIICICEMFHICGIFFIVFPLYSSV